MPTRHHSQLAKIIQTLRLLNPTSLKDPIDAKTMGDLANLTPKQVSPCLSILHYTGYLTRIGTLGRYALYIRTTKPMPRRSSPIEKRYKRHLGRRSCRYYTTSPKQIAIEVSQAVITALRQEEIFSNLKFTQRLYDVLIDQGSITPPDPVDLSRAISAACEVLPELLREDGVRIDQLSTTTKVMPHERQ